MVLDGPKALKGGRPYMFMAHEGKKWTGHSPPSPIASVAYAPINKSISISPA